MLCRLCLLVVFTLTAIAAAAAPIANAATPEPPGTPPNALPPHPATPPKAELSSVNLLRGRLSGRKLTLTLACRDSGRLALSMLGQQRSNRIAESRLACEGARAKTTLTVSRRIARKARTRKGLKLRATIAGGGKRSEFTLHITGRRSPSARAAWDDAFAYGPQAWCTGLGFTVAVFNTGRFGANYGEQVWWRPIGLEYNSSTRTYSWNYGPPNVWASHIAVPGEGSIYIN